MSWSLVILIAVAFGLLYAWNMYKKYRDAEQEDKPRLVKIYAGIAVISVVVFVAIKLIIPPIEGDYIDEQQDFQHDFIEDIIQRTESPGDLP